MGAVGKDHAAQDARIIVELAVGRQLLLCPPTLPQCIASASVLDLHGAWELIAAVWPQAAWATSGDLQLFPRGYLSLEQRGE